VDLVAHIGEVDQRGLYARRACSSMFVYCTEILHLSEAEAYLRIVAARAARKYPMLLVMLGEGRLHLSGIAILAPHLTEENCDWPGRRTSPNARSRSSLPSFRPGPTMETGWGSMQNRRQDG